MKTLLVAALGLAALASLPSVSQAADGCGPGWYDNGDRCVPMRREYRDYDEGPRFYDRERYRDDYGDRGHPYGYNRDYGDPRCGRPNYTIQDGVCKPYTGR
jgi:hypothetical protein